MHKNTILQFKFSAFSVKSSALTPK